MDLGVHEIDYLALAYWHGFVYRVGELTGIDRGRRVVQVAPFIDEEGRQVTPLQRIRLRYARHRHRQLTNDFGTPRREATCHRARDRRGGRALPQARWSTPASARMRRASRWRPEQLQVAIIGAGATGTELAAELHKTTRQLVAYGLDRIDPDKDIKINLIEAAPRILPALPERVAKAANKLLEGLERARPYLARVAEVRPNGVTAGQRHVDSGRTGGVGRPASRRRTCCKRHRRARDQSASTSWWCGRRCRPRATTPFLPSATARPARGPGTNGRCRRAPRQPTSRPRIWPSSCPRRISRASRCADWHYRDFGSLVSLGDYSTVGSLMGKLIGRNLFIEGMFAGLMYKSLYKMHQLALHGWTKVGARHDRPHDHPPHRAGGEAALRAATCQVPDRCPASLVPTDLRALPLRRESRTSPDDDLGFRVTGESTRSTGFRGRRPGRRAPADVRRRARMMRAPSSPCRRSSSTSE